MDLSGKIKDVQIEYKTHKAIVSLIVNEEPRGIENLFDVPLSIKLSRHRNTRSLDSNAYFHVLCDKLRQKSNVSMSAMKNHLITSYGQVEYLDDEMLVYKTNAAPEYINELEEVHMKFIKRGDDGAYWYRMYRGSHTYNSEEMSRLIEGTIFECQNEGIETATPDELAHMQELWEKRRGCLSNH